jgi:N-acetyl-anhydromuramyl-L-alanine amidase AmpD
MKVNGTNIPKDLGNRYLIGIEIEASRTDKLNKKNRTTPKSGLNPIQLETVAKFCAALFDSLNWSTEAAIRHKDWTPRKIDVGIPLQDIHDKINEYRKKSPSSPKPVPPVAKPTIPTVALDDLRLGKRSTSAIIVKDALNKEFGTKLPKTKVWGRGAMRVYKKWQKANGFYGKDADGNPGRSTLRMLAKKYQFKII